jgi:glyoxylate/hydroxypyruvate/2-ketogluconate reductase
MKPKVFVARPIPKEVEAYIAEHCDYEKWEKEESIPRAELFEKIRDVDGLITSGTLIDSELLEHAPRLKIASNISVGYNNFDIAAMREKRVIGTNTPSVLDDTVADLVLALMLSAARRIPELDRLVKDGKWVGGKDKYLFGRDVHHAKLGIIGMGRIGEAIVQRAKYGFDMDVMYYNRRPKPETEEKFEIRYAALDDLLKESDFIVLMTPLTPETTNLIGKREFGLMKQTAIFINASRGQTVDEQAMIEALQSGQIYAAGLDVFQKEPVDPENPLLKMANVVTLPHIGSATERTRFEMAMTAAKNLVAGVTGGKPESVVEELKSISSN